MERIAGMMADAGRPVFEPGWQRLAGQLALLAGRDGDAIDWCRRESAGILEQRALLEAVPDPDGAIRRHHEELRLRTGHGCVDSPESGRTGWSRAGGTR